MMKYRSLALLIPMLAAACGGDPSAITIGGATGGGAGSTTTSNGSGNGSGGGSSVTTGPEPDNSFTVTFGPLKVASGTERTQCVVKRLSNLESIHVSKIHNVLSGPSHHLIVYRTADTEEKLTPFDCQPFTDTLDPSKGSPLMITQKHDELLELPKGVAFTLDPNQMVRLEMHYINASFDDIDVQASTTFIPIDEGTFENEADFLFIGNPDISIPAGSKATLGPTFLAVPANLEGVNFFGITGHTHQWGTNVTVALADSKAGPDKMIYDVPNWQWSEPATVYLDPPVSLPSGGGFRFTCSWENKGAKTVSFGESANDEMCFFWTYYYPSKGALVCAHTDKVQGGYDLCCPGNPFCSQIF